MRWPLSIRASDAQVSLHALTTLSIGACGQLRIFAWLSTMRRSTCSYRYSIAAYACHATKLCSRLCGHAALLTVTPDHAMRQSLGAGRSVACSGALVTVSCRNVSCRVASCKLRAPHVVACALSTWCSVFTVLHDSCTCCASHMSCCIAYCKLHCKPQRNAFLRIRLD